MKHDNKKEIASSNIKKNYKDTLFRMIFQEKENLLNLYNAVNGTLYTNVGDLEIVTLENAIYMNMKNDVAFVLIDHLNMYEHQSTYNPNMPLRDLFYISREYEKLVNSRLLYTTTPVKLPTPRFVVFYNGTEKRPEQQILKLSDFYQKKVDEPELELKVHMLNINPGYNEKLLEQCKPLREYMQYVQKVRDYATKLSIEEAVNIAVDECIKEDVLEEFLTKFKQEAIQVSIFEYDEEGVIRLIRQDERAQGIQQGIRQGEKNMLLKLIKVKLNRDETISQIAKELEETEDKIKTMIEQINTDDIT